MIKRLGNTLFFIGLALGGLLLWGVLDQVPETEHAARTFGYAMAFAPVMIGALCRYVLGSID